jgi:uncharacterized protein
LCVFHEGDLDGQCSGAIVKYKFPEAILYPINYGDKFSWAEIKSDDIIYMCDFSLPIREMIQLDLKILGGLRWIDHHKGVIEDHNNFLEPYPIMGIRDTSKAACRLTWEYLFPDKEVPMFIKLLSAYDLLQHEDIEEFSWKEIDALQYGLRVNAWKSSDPNISMEIWEDLIIDGRTGISYLRDIIDDGFLIKNYVSDQNSKIIEQRSYIQKWEGHKCLFVNSDPHIANTMPESEQYKENNCDMAVNYFNVKNKYWVINLRTDKDNIDLSVIAKKYGGGGHQKAAGFQIIDKDFKEILD